MRGDPFVLDDLSRPARILVEWLLNVPAFRELRRNLRQEKGQSLERAVLDALDVSLDVDACDLARLPSSGAAMVVANHPHGALDGLLMVDLVTRVRSDVRVLANHVLARIPELRERCFFVDPFGGPAAAARSRAGLRAAHLWLRQGGALVAFPAGEVAPRLANGQPSDGPWHATVLRLAEKTGARIVRTHISGRNSRLFYALGRVHPRLRTAWLGRELLRQRGRAIAVRVTEPEDAVASEIATLPADARLVASGSFEVICAEGSRIPATLRELGRLREVTFRAVGEGTGRASDLDTFDERYLHLVLWDGANRRVVGAYRIGRTDVLQTRHGVEGLYTRTLFHYDHRLLDRLGSPALELGRSFVRKEYQRNYNALLLLWRGIGEFVVRHPQYRFLFGPVSISARYRDVSQAMLVAFLRHNHLSAGLSELVSAMNPWRAKDNQPSAGPPASIDELNRVIAGYEVDGKGVPVLLRQYLKLNARVLSFSVDPAFGDALDALMVVDLTQVSSTILSRYMGRDGAHRFLTTHRVAPSSRAA